MTRLVDPRVPLTYMGESLEAIGSIAAVESRSSLRVGSFARLKREQGRA